MEHQGANFAACVRLVARLQCKTWHSSPIMTSLSSLPPLGPLHSLHVTYVDYMSLH